MTTVHTCKLIIQTKFRWWMWPTIRLYLFMCEIADVEPDQDVLNDMVMGAALLRLKGERKWRPAYEVLGD